MNQASVVALMKAIAPAIRDYLSDAVMPLHRRIAVLEQAPKPATDEFIRHIASESASEAALAAASLIREQFDALPVPKDGKDGLDGEKGDPGRDGTPGAVGLDGKDGRDGVDGKDGSPGLAGAPGKDGEPGQPGLNGKDGAEGRGVRELLIDADGNLVATYTDGVVKAVGRVRGADGVGRDGRDGLPGADGQKGRDGIDGKNGRDGFGFENLTATYDGERKFAFRFASGEETKEFAFTLPFPIDRGVWREGKYERGDVVTFGGSAFIAQRDTSEKPETSDTWRLSVKRGQNGKDGALIPAKSTEPIRMK